MRKFNAFTLTETTDKFPSPKEKFNFPLLQHSWVGERICGRTERSEVRIARKLSQLCDSTLTKLSERGANSRQGAVVGEE